MTEKLKDATRVEAKGFKENILELERKMNHHQKQLAVFDDKLKKKHAMIMRLNDKTYKAAIKTTMLGKDAAKSEYWHFKDDNTRLYIRFEEEVPIGGVQKALSLAECDAEMKEEPAAVGNVGDAVDGDM